MIFSTVVAALGTLAVAQAASWIVPGAVWMSTANSKIDAHGGMVLQDGNRFYWVGYSISNGIRPYMYESTDLVNWQPSKNPQSSFGQLWRPKLAKPNGSWWIYGQHNRNVQALKSSSINQNYAASGSPVTLPPNGYTYSDTGMFYDDGDKTWYLLTSADHNEVQINRINSDGSVGARVNVLKKGSYEAPGMLKINGIYYLIVSGKTGYRNNPNKVFWASSLSGSWNGPTDIAPPEQNTYNSQNTFELTVKGSKKTTYIYMGDSWLNKGGPESNYVWLPISVDSNNKKLTLQYHAQWKLNVATGEVQVPSAKRRYEAEHADLAGRAVVRDCEHCVSKRGVHEIGSDSEVVFHNVTGLGGRQWVQLHYRLNNREAGEAHISVNDEAPVNVSSLNTRAGYHHIVPVELDLREGAVNKIAFGMTGRSTGDEAGVVLDGIEVIED